MSYDNTNKGVLFPNKYKKQPNHPDYTGTINLDGVEKQVAGWVKKSQSGGSFLSLSLSEPKEKKAPSTGKANFDPNDVDMNTDSSDLPF